MPRPPMVLHAVVAEWTELKTVCLLIRCEGSINGFREITVAAIARLHLRQSCRSLTMQLISNQYYLRLQHRPRRLLVESMIVM